MLTVDEARLLHTVSDLLGYVFKDLESGGELCANARTDLAEAMQYLDAFVATHVEEESGMRTPEEIKAEQERLETLFGKTWDANTLARLRDIMAAVNWCAGAIEPPPSHLFKSLENEER